MHLPRHYAVVVRSVPPVALPGGFGRTLPWHYAVVRERVVCGWCTSREQAWVCALATLRGMMRCERFSAAR